VLLVDRGAIGSGASSAAAGVLAVAGGSDEGARLALRRASLARVPALVAALADETGCDVGLALEGTIEPALDDAEAVALQARVARRQAEGFAVGWCEPAVVRAEAPVLPDAVRGAACFADDGHLHGGRFTTALAEAARARGAVVVPGAEVHAVERVGDRIARVGVLHEWVTPGLVVLAAGAWSPRVAGIAPHLPVRPVRGQMLALRPPGPSCARVVAHRDGYLVPRRDGELLVGATMEDVGFDQTVTPGGLRALLAHLDRLAPGARGWPLARVWAGLRPGADDGPFIGPHPALANCIVATGHGRNGILLAAVTADAVAALADGASAPPEAAPFAPRA
jgi:glycine oxidase